MVIVEKTKQCEKATVESFKGGAWTQAVKRREALRAQGGKDRDRVVVMPGRHAQTMLGLRLQTTCVGGHAPADRTVARECLGGALEEGPRR